MNILIIGQGGREHAIAWKIRQSKHANQIFVIPGNDGMKDVAKIVDIAIDDYPSIISFAIENNIDLTIVGSEKPLCDGLVDMMEEKGLKVFGPSKRAAEIEGSKAFAKMMMGKYNIPTASYHNVKSFEEAKRVLIHSKYPIVIKADGLAAGKGVVIAKDFHEAFEASVLFLGTNKSIVIEEYLVGIEFSLIAFANGKTMYPFELAQDYKRAFDHHQGPNTGGMGSYSPVPSIPKEAIHEAIEKVMKPMLYGLEKENRSFKGFLYGGLMLTKDGVKVIEFNARLGDPEAEVLLPRLEDDMIETIMSIMNHESRTLTFSKYACVGVVMASQGYPGHYDKGYPIEIKKQDSILFHMGTKYENGKFVTNGGRVLIAVSLGENIEEARHKTYQALKNISCENIYFRNDIGIL